MEPALKESWLWYGPFLFGIEVVLFFIILFVGYLLYRRKWRKSTAPPQTEIHPESTQSFNELVEKTQQAHAGAPLDILLESGCYSVDRQVTVTSSLRLVGQGATETRIVSGGKFPALKIENAQQCVITNLKIEGAIQCHNSELLVENCYIASNADGICIEALDGSVVTVSGVISSEGGIAIHAKGKSKVVIMTPYGITDEDFIVVDPKSKITLQYPSMEPHPSADRNQSEG